MVGTTDRAARPIFAVVPTVSDSDYKHGANVDVAEPVFVSAYAATPTLGADAVSTPTGRGGAGVRELFATTGFARTSDPPTTLARVEWER
jgi:hypothetical protein